MCPAPALVVAVEDSCDLDFECKRAGGLLGEFKDLASCVHILKASCPLLLSGVEIPLQGMDETEPTPTASTRLVRVTLEVP